MTHGILVHQINPHPDLPAWCCWSERIMSDQFPQNSSMGCGKWSRGNSTDTPQGTLGNLPPMMETCDKVDRTWWMGLPNTCGSGETNSCGMHAYMPAHVVAIRLAKAFVNSDRITCDESDDMHEDYHRNSWSQKPLPEINWQMSTRSRKTTRIHWTPKNLPDQPVAQHTRALKFINLVPVSRIHVHATTDESGTSTNILDILDIGINAMMRLS